MTEKWINDTGLVFAAGFIIIGIKYGVLFLWLALALIAVIMFFPAVLYPLAFGWKIIAEFLGKITPWIFFGLIFFIVITPIGLIRRMFNQDPFFTRRFKDYASGFTDRRHIFTKADIIKPY